MRATLGLTLALVVLLQALGQGEAGSLHRRFREVKDEPAIAVPIVLNEPDTLQLRKDQIPVTIIELQPEPAAPAPAAPALLAEQTVAIAEDIVKAVEAEEAVLTEGKAVLSPVPAAELSPLPAAEPVATIPKAEEPFPLTIPSEPVAEETETLVVAASEPEVVQLIKELHKEALPVAPTELSSDDLLDTAAIPEAAVAVVEPQVLAEPEPLPQEVLEEVIVAVAPTDEADSLNVRQATAATPTQTSTQQNFVQQLIQNSPIGQFLNQFTSGQQQQQQLQQQQQAGQLAADEPATPAPTLPGFLNPITSAQQAVQNVAQSVVNSTSQAFQGIQQFASNLGNQFQNTLSSLGGQQTQLSTSDSTTTRRPGPLQSIVNNFVGGGSNNNNNDNNQATPAAPGQPQGPLQGIINFFQGGNRPQTTTTGVTAGTPAPVVPAKEEQAATLGSVPAKPAQPGIDNKLEIESDATNEVQSDEDSFEDAAGGELITVNDDSAAGPVFGPAAAPDQPESVE